METHIFISRTGDGFKNLAVDEYLLKQYHDGALHGVTLYFFVNDNAVIIGRNQNAWRECVLERMELDGVQLVRRHTGGGAVYHDKGNLNFSFITDEKHFDKERQTKVIAEACRKLGIETTVSGRNDILADGRKFSGNAYAVLGRAMGHHGTLLVSTNTEKLANYLNVSPQKLAAKGVASVKSRVCNLSDFKPVTVQEVRDAVIKSFLEEYGGEGDMLDIDYSSDDVKALIDKQASWEWRLGKAPAFDHIIEKRFSFGELQLMLNVKNGIVSEAKVCTDALDTSLAEEIRQRILGSRFDRREMTQMLLGGSEACCEIAEYLLENKDQNRSLDERQKELIIKARHELHNIPELSCEETRTKAYIIDFLNQHTTLEIFDMGRWLYAAHREQAGETIAFRADFDAVPTGDGCAAHRCGHDGHTASLLALALLIEGKTLGKSVILLFQHAEETGVGGAECCELFKREHIDKLYGCHNIPGYPLGRVLLKSGTFACASCGMQAGFFGKPTHAAYPENGINPTPAVGQLALRLPEAANEIGKKHGAMTIATIVGMYSGEKAFGVAASNGAVYATLRSESGEALKELIERARELVCDYSAEAGVKHDIILFDVFPSTVNEPDEVMMIEEKLIDGNISFAHLDVPFRWSEDFGRYGSHTKAVFFGLGSGEDTPPLHTSLYEYPDELAIKTAEVFYSLI